ncbi:phosphoglycerate kinase [Halomonas sp. ZH2S]|uniref:Phosphoglycerate kinase n=1 Tax=Vreelandella zhuhanensis TaxID=2684210 RepID=A0A7X3KRR5_9GAMM|nr:phosphoglycerate kinase [Halomonas zhuhanensis]MWJ29128.1 phosphoglycerate kinase [Halomonas zhuhanensis]
MNTLSDLNLTNSRALVRVDFNVPRDDEGTVLDDSRIRAALPTLRYLLEKNVACVLMSHLGRPGGEPVASLSLASVAEKLSELLPGKRIRHCEEVVGSQAEEMARSLGGGEILLLENLRFHPGEKDNDDQFAKALAGLGDIYVNDAFSACHRKHASVHAIATHFPADKRAVGCLVEQEIEALDKVVDNPQRPLVAVFGGAKVADKLEAIHALIGRAEQILIGGAMAYTFLRAQGVSTGSSKVEEDRLDDAREILEKAGDKLLLPTDHVMGMGEETRTGREITGDWMGMDIGPETASRYAKAIGNAATVVWNGPMGKIEEERYFSGTRHIAEAMAASRAVTVVGGGETGQAVHRVGIENKLTHLSTGGGAFLDYLAHGSLPALNVLKED